MISKEKPVQPECPHAVIVRAEPEAEPTCLKCQQPMQTAGNPDQAPAEAAAPETEKAISPLLKRLAEGRKLRARSNSEMSKLKKVWREVLSDEDKEVWRDLFQSDEKPEDTRGKMREKLQIDLRYDNQLARFRKWVKEEDAGTDDAERMETEEKRLREAHPEWTLDMVRDQVIKGAYYRTLARGDFTLGLQTIRVHTTVKKFLLDLEKFKFDALTACREHLPQLKSIEESSTLTEEQKTEAFMQKIFGTQQP